MKKLQKIILWCIVGFIIFMIIGVSFLTNAPFEVSTADNILYKLQMILFFLPFMIGALLQLDIFHLRQHIPLLKKKKIWATVVYWIIVGCVVPIAMIFVVDCFFSSDYKAKNYAYSLEMNAIREREEDSDLKESTTQNTITQEAEKSKEMQTNVNNIKEENSNLKESTAQNATTEESTKEEKIALTWSDLKDDSNTYISTMEILGRTFRFEEFSDDVKSELVNEDVKELVSKLYKDYIQTGKLDTDFQNAFTEFCKKQKYETMYYEENKNYSFYDTLSYSFVISWKYEKDGTESYFIDVPDYSEDIYAKNPEYINAEGYIDNGCKIYMDIDNEMKEVGIVEEVVYGSVIDDVAYAFGVKIYSNEDGISEWHDGEKMFSTWKDTVGVPLYFLNKHDSNRRTQKADLNYDSYFNWVKLANVSELREKNVYMGTGNCKRYMFTIVDYNSKEDLMIVQYPDGSQEVKSCSAIVFNDTLFIMDE